MTFKDAFPFLTLCLADGKDFLDLTFRYLWIQLKESYHSLIIQFYVIKIEGKKPSF